MIVNVFYHPPEVVRTATYSCRDLYIKFIIYEIWNLLSSSMDCMLNLFGLFSEFSTAQISSPTDGLLSFTKHTHPNTFKGRIPELLPCNNSHGDFHSNTLEGILLINVAAVKTACPHNCFGTFIEIIMLLVSSRRCLFFVLQVFTNSCTWIQIRLCALYCLLRSNVGLELIISFSIALYQCIPTSHLLSN